MRRLGPTLIASAALLLALATRPAPAADVRPLALAVFDEQGQFVSDLKRDEVRVLENGEPRELAGFERDERSLAAVLVLDTSVGAGRVFRTQAFDAVWGFVSRLPPGTRCILWTTGDRPKNHGALGSERKDVDKKVGQGFASEGTNALMDTVGEAANALASESGKRRALVVLTGNGAGHTTATPADVTSAARKAGGPLFALMYDEGGGVGAGSLMLGDAPRDANNITIVGPADHQRVLSGLAQGTGGRFERVASAAGAGAPFQAFAADLAGQYRLRYVPGDARGPKRLEVQIARTAVHWRVALDAP
jgi:VWFA-related protein